MNKVAKYSTWTDEHGQTHIYGAGAAGPYGTHPPQGHPMPGGGTYNSPHAGQSHGIPSQHATQGNIDLLSQSPKPPKPPASAATGTSAAGGPTGVGAPQAAPPLPAGVGGTAV